MGTRNSSFLCRLNVANSTSHFRNPTSVFVLLGAVIGCRLDGDDVVRGGFLLASGAHADVPGVDLEGLEISRTEVTHAGLDAADEFAQNEIQRTGSFLESLDALGSGLGHGVLLVMAVAGGGTVLHGLAAAHATVLFVQLAVDFHDAARGFVATREQSTADEAVGEGERLHHVAGFRDAAVGEDGTPYALW